MDRDLLTAVIYVTLLFIAVLTVLAVRRKPLSDHSAQPLEVFKSKRSVEVIIPESEGLPSISPTLRGILRGIVDSGMELNDFEQKFCRDILNSNHYLSLKQTEVIIGMWRRASARGFTGGNNGN